MTLILEDPSSLKIPKQNLKNPISNYDWYQSIELNHLCDDNNHIMNNHNNNNNNNNDNNNNNNNKMIIMTTITIMMMIM